MLTASAPISSEVLNYLKVSCCCPIMEAYGLTESCGGNFVFYLNLYMKYYVIKVLF